MMRTIADRPAIGRVLGLLALLIVYSEAKSEEGFEWEPRLEILRSEVAAQREELDRLSDSLRDRVTTEAPDRLGEVTMLPEPKRRGWGLLPEWTESGSGEKPRLRRTVYSLAWIERRLIEESERQAQLWQGLEDLEPVGGLVDAFRQRVRDQRNLQAHVDYHDQWQRSIIRYPLFFQQRNALLPRVEELSRLVEEDVNPDRQLELRREVLESLEVFRPSEGLEMLRDQRGWRLPVELCTDITDLAFLEQARKIIEEAFIHQLVASGESFRVSIRWRRVSLEQLYPNGGKPRVGTPIDVDDHLARFEHCARILTTGAAATYAIAGSHVVLGNGPTDSGVLAHEFGHLLGFQDAYLRAYRGDPLSPEGATIIEWWGLSDGLMGGSRSGGVTDAMVETLLEAYGKGGLTSP